MLNLDSLGIINSSDFVICERYNRNDLEKICDSAIENSLIFLNLSQIDEYTAELIGILYEKQIKVRIVFMQYDFPLTEDLYNRYEPYVNQIFSVNAVMNKPKLFHYPLGFRDDKYNPHSYMIQEKQKEVQKKHVAFMCLTMNTHERRICWNNLKDEKFIHTEPQQNYGIHTMGDVLVKVDTPPPVFFEKMHESYFTVCPAGVGVDTHRFYESIYLDSIPIVKRSSINKLLEFFPCLFVDNWSDITFDLLRTNIAPMTQKLREFKEKYPDWFNNPLFFINNPISTI